MHLIERITQLKEESPTGKILAEFLEAYLNPAFGSLPKSEIDLSVLDMLIKLGFIQSSPTLYELVTKLRVTRTKAKQLLYQRELRKFDESNLQEALKTLLARPLIQKTGNFGYSRWRIHSLIDFIRDRMNTLGHLTDGSFSPNLIKLSLEGMSALIESSLNPDQKEATRLALIKAGAPDTSVRGVILALLKKMGSHVADYVGEKAVEESFAILSPLLQGSLHTITTQVQKLFT